MGERVSGETCFILVFCSSPQISPFPGFPPSFFFFLHFSDSAHKTHPYSRYLSEQLSFPVGTAGQSQPTAVPVATNRSALFPQSGCRCSCLFPHRLSQLGPVEPHLPIQIYASYTLLLIPCEYCCPTPPSLGHRRGNVCL